MRTSTRSLLLLIAVLCVSDVVVGSFFKQVHKPHCTDVDFISGGHHVFLDRLRICLCLVGINLSAMASGLALSNALTVVRCRYHDFKLSRART